MIYAEDKCVVCGKTYTPKYGNQICCSKECSMQRQKGMYKKWQETNKGRRAKRRKKSIADISRECRERGISYGRYQVLEREGKLGVNEE